MNFIELTHADLLWNEQYRIKGKLKTGDKNNEYYWI